MMEIIHVLQYKDKYHIVKENTPGDDMFVILNGQVIVAKENKVIAKLGKGDFFGEMSLIDRAPRSATIIVDREAVCMKINRNSLFELFALQPRIATKIFWAFLQNLNRRLRTLDSQRYESLQLPPLPADDDLPFLRSE